MIYIQCQEELKSKLRIELGDTKSRTSITPSFSVPKQGIYQIYVLLDNTQVIGSPFVLHVVSSVDIAVPILIKSLKSAQSRQEIKSTLSTQIIHRSFSRNVK